MREIKFRAWDESTKTMHTMDRRTRYENTLRAGQILERFDCVSQFTGLHDRDGVEIYGGDVVTCQRMMDGNVFGNAWRTLPDGEVVPNPQLIQTDSDGVDWVWFDDIRIHPEIWAVVGNIYENDEYRKLMK